MTSTGFLALILHAHLPYVRHPEYDEFLEEDWLYEAITETYLPLLELLYGMADDGVAFQLTMSLTPPLCHMLRDPLLQDRYERYIERSIALAKCEVDRTQHEGQLNEIARFYLNRLTQCRNAYVDRWQRDLVKAFAELQNRGVLEIITCAATHGFLPLMENFPESVRAQILLARDDYRENFGCDPRGIWLPECAYVASLDQVLQEANLRWFILDSHGLMFGNPRPRYAIYAPCFTPAGPAAFGRDRDSSRQVWSAEEGYPGDPAYRDFYRDIGFDLSLEYLREFLPADGTRRFTGLKYHRITGRTRDKELYNRGWAMGAADANASHFMGARAAQIQHLRGNMNVPPIVVSPFDAELFGHWWFEGPEFLNLFIRKSVYDQNVFQLSTPTNYLSEHNTHQLVVPSASSWGHKGYWEVWLDDSNSWIYPHLHIATRRMTEQARAFQDNSDPLTDRALQQMARELLLAQSSDWAFLMKTGTAKSYATKRTKDHVLRFTRLYDQVRARDIDEAFLVNCEWRDNIFQNSIGAIMRERMNRIPRVAARLQRAERSALNAQRLTFSGSGFQTWTLDVGRWALLLLLLPTFALAQEIPPIKKPGVRISFLPPPMEGTLSLGIYDKRGKLVRVLHREATEKDFTVGLNGLITSWDGKDDAGQVAPVGSYDARGFCVGPLELEGVAMHGNDWITDEDLPRFTHVKEVRAAREDFEVVLTSLDGQRHTRKLGLTVPPSAAGPINITAKIEGGEVQLSDARGSREVPLAGGKAIDAAVGYGNCLWVLVKTADNVEVREYSQDGEFLRRLGYAPGEPLPKRVVASLSSEQIVLLEESVEVERLRVLELGTAEATSTAAAPVIEAGAEATSLWKVTAEKQIWKSDTFEAIKSRLVRPGGKPFAPEPKIGISLLANPLLKDTVTALNVTLAFDRRGSYLQTADGLPLHRIAETANLKWAVMGREGGKVVTIFQGDGAVVEEFKARKLANMMAFDAGDYEWAPAKEK